MKSTPKGLEVLVDGDRCGSCKQGYLKNMVDAFKLRCSVCKHTEEKHCLCTFDKHHCKGCGFFDGCFTGTAETVTEAI